MEGYQIRNATSSDIPHLMKLDHGYSTEYVWQMAYNQDREAIAITFRELRLPRPMRVGYPRKPGLLADEWVLRTGFLVAEREGIPIGYIAFVDGPAPGSAWVTDIVVGLPERRQGVGSQLVRTGMKWCIERGLSSIYLEMQSKNYPAISLSRKLGFRFTGFSDSYFPDQDIALFFRQDLV
jgi:ribosomal protein S18 acetylase RimI-like enzyme